MSLPPIRSDVAAYDDQPFSWLRWLRVVVLCPGYVVLRNARYAHACYRSRALHPLSRVFWLLNIYVYGVEIAPQATLGRAIGFPHPRGITIGKGAAIGDNVTIYQNVTIGQRTQAEPACPTIGANAILYTGAVVAGGITVGQGASVGANSVVLESIPAHKTAVGIPARILKAGKAAA